MYSKLKQDSGSEMALGISKSILNLVKIIQEKKPDLIFAGFDIGANLAASIVGSHLNIPVAHIEGGEISGTIDESIRHATTKFSHLHFVTHIEAKNRLMRLGENPKYIHVVGNPSLDSIKEIKNIPKKDLEKEFSINLSKPFFIILQHTVTSEIKTIDKLFKKTIDAVNQSNVQSILIYGNADAGSEKILKQLKKSKIKQYPSLKFEKFINLLKHSNGLIGNSSCGIMECPYLKIPSINIGTRQAGRMHSSSVIDTQYDENQIKDAIKKILFDESFKKNLKNIPSIYGNGDSSKKIIKILEKINSKEIPLQKRMYE